ncbi:hypothetical protein ACP4OV_019823 [Aristida adscensionis]
MRATSICASFLSALLLLHCFLMPSSGVGASKERIRIQSRKLLQNVLMSSEKAQVFHAGATAANKIPGVEVSENLKKQTPSKSNPIQN